MTATGARYRPFHTTDNAFFSMDWSPILPPGLGIVSTMLTVVRNTNPTQPAPEVAVSLPAEGNALWDEALWDEGQWGSMGIEGRITSARCSGGNAGTDYQFRWAIVDSADNTWGETAFALCVSGGPAPPPAPAPDPGPTPVPPIPPPATQSLWDQAQWNISPWN